MGNRLTKDFRKLKSDNLLDELLALAGNFVLAENPDSYWPGYKAAKTEVLRRLTLCAVETTDVAHDPQIQ